MVPIQDRSGSRPVTALPPVVFRRRRYVTALAFFSWLCACAAGGGRNAVLLDFEGIGDVQVVGSYYGGQPGGGPDYGIVFGPSVFSGVPVEIPDRVPDEGLPRQGKEREHDALREEAEGIGKRRVSGERGASRRHPRSGTGRNALGPQFSVRPGRCPAVDLLDVGVGLDVFTLRL
jgi:hypothetical protein